MRVVVRSLMMSSLIALSLSGCNKEEGAAAGAADSGAANTNAIVVPAAPEGDLAAAEKIYKERCQLCHGEKGMGDGAGAAALNPKPRTFTDKAWQASVTNEHLATVIAKGGPAVGKSMLMPPNPDLEGKPDVITGLVHIVRNFAR